MKRNGTWGCLLLILKRLREKDPGGGEPFGPRGKRDQKELEEFTRAVIDNTKTVVSEIDGLMAMDVRIRSLKDRQQCYHPLMPYPEK